jgi:DNA invertase Pin-like site-specific DNA recombinase
VRKVDYDSPRTFLRITTKTVAYLRGSTGGQDLAAQKLAILDYARRHRFWVLGSSRLSSPRVARQRGRIFQTIEAPPAGDRLVVRERSRLGQSLGQILQAVDQLLKKGVGLIVLKESIRLEGKQNLQTKVTLELFELFAEIERALISERTKEGLAAARARGRLLGRLEGSLRASKLDGKEDKIRMLLGKWVSKASIAKILEVAPSTLLPHPIAPPRTQGPSACLDDSLADLGRKARIVAARESHSTCYSTSLIHRGHVPDHDRRVL